MQKTGLQSKAKTEDGFRVYIRAQPSGVVESSHVMDEICR